MLGRGGPVGCLGWLGFEGDGPADMVLWWLGCLWPYASVVVVVVLGEVRKRRESLYAVLCSLVKQICEEKRELFSALSERKAENWDYEVEVTSLLVFNSQPQVSSKD